MEGTRWLSGTRPELFDLPVPVVGIVVPPQARHEAPGSGESLTNTGTNSLTNPYLSETNARRYLEARRMA